MKALNCPHTNKFAMPDSVATVCEQCGQVWVWGEMWQYKSGNITEWVKDLVEAREKKEAEDER